MIMETAVQVSNEYRNLPVTQLQESTSNPRKRFDAKSLEELASSFKAQGVLQPLLVRALEEDKYEVIAGARRLADEIGVGHALEIAKLPQPEQQRAFEAAFHTVWSGGKETR